MLSILLSIGAMASSPSPPFSSFWFAWSLRLVSTLLLGLAIGGGSGQRALVQAGRIGGTIGEERDVAHELSIDTFNASLWAAPASWALVEFYASWCPACRNYKPQYERVAKLFNGPTAAHPGVVYVAKVDCAQKANQKLCERFAVAHFPTLLWGMPSKFAWGKITSNADSRLEVVETNRKAEGLLQWINRRLDKEYTFNDAAQESGQSSNSGDLFDQSKTVLFGHDLEEVAAQAYEIILDNKMLNQKSRAPFVAFLQLLLLHHPSERCRKGSAAILTSLENTWPISSNFEDITPEGRMPDSAGPLPDLEALQKRKICGNGLPKGSWISCRGSRNDTRGYSCGLWLLFHSLSTRVDDTESSAAFEAMHEFISHFFACEDCRKHFLQLSSRYLNDLMDVLFSMLKRRKLNVNYHTVVAILLCDVKACVWGRLYRIDLHSKELTEIL
ncbi:hypothetical protein O6H91_Y096500 [Diphasiastrum complanatum]|nr:hypothetical protein O6H91_Y096500 [Diphasiastrum complanatum]